MQGLPIVNLARVALAERTIGWLLGPDGPYLRDLAFEAGGPVLEMGSYCGKSTIWLGDGAEAAGHIMVSVDWHRGAHDMHTQPEVLDVDGKVDTLPNLRRTIIEAGLDGTVVIVCGTSVQAAALFTATLFSLIFIDGAHDRASVQADVDLWAPHVRLGGVLAFHDYDYPEVAEVVDALTDGWQPEGLKGCVRALRKIAY